MTEPGRKRARASRTDDVLRRPKRWMAAFLLVVGAACVAIQAASLVRGSSPALIVSDGKQYYAWARSVVLDGDLDFRNDYALLYPPDPLPPEAEQVTPKGLVVNKYPVGMAVLETPGLLLGHAAARLLPGGPADGVSTPYQVAVSSTLTAFVLLGAYALFLAALRLGAAPFAAGSLTAAMLVSTNLWHYVAKEPTMPHGAGVALGGIALFLMSGWEGPWESVSRRQLLAVGACVGLLFLVRNSNVFLAPALGALAFRARPLSLRPVLFAGAPAVALAALQPVAFSLLQGGLRLVPYPDEGFAGGIENVVRTLDSSRHGLLVYHPLYALLLAVCLAGLFRPAARRTAAGALASFGLLLVVNGTWWCWWFGDSFGNRAFIEALPPLVLASAVALSPRAPRRPGGPLLAAALVLATLLNASLWTGYVLKRFPQDGRHSVRAAWLWFLPGVAREPGEARGAGR